MPPQTDSSASIHWFTALPDLGLIEVAGADAPRFLQGQATCDILALDDHTSTLGAFCTPKGRVLAVFRAYRQNDRYYLILPRELIESLIKRLRMYVLRSAVSLTDLGSERICIGLSTAAGLFDFVPEMAVRDVRHGDSHTAVAIPSTGAPRTLLITTPEQVERVVQAAEAAGFEPLTPNAWHLEDIRAGLPTVLPGTVETFIPQMLNLDLLDGIGFKKGCYTGQEVVARTHYLGTVKRRMHRLLATSGNKPTAGAALFADGEEQTAGTVVCSAASSDGRVELLAVLNGESATTSTLRLERSRSEPLVVADPT